MPPAAKYSITVNIEQKTLNVLREDPRKILVLVRDIELDGGDVANGNIVFATYASADLSRTQTFTWEEIYSISETTEEFKVGLFILWLMHTIDDWHVAWLRSRVGDGRDNHLARPDSRLSS
jgi:hypothetical protein